MFLIPTQQTPFWQQTTTLDGTDYLLEFRYNQRENVYYLMIMQPDTTVLAQGIKLVSNYRILQAYASDSLPPGELVAFATGNDSPAGLGELGIGLRVQLVYVTAVELKALKLDGWRL